MITNYDVILASLVVLENGLLHHLLHHQPRVSSLADHLGSYFSGVERESRAAVRVKSGVNSVFNPDHLYSLPLKSTSTVYIYSLLQRKSWSVWTLVNVGINSTGPDTPNFKPSPIYPQ